MVAGHTSSDLQNAFDPSHQLFDVTVTSQNGTETVYDRLVRQTTDTSSDLSKNNYHSLPHDYIVEAPTAMHAASAVVSSNSQNIFETRPND